MNAEQRTLYRTAEGVRKLLTQDARPAACLPGARWNQLEKLIRQIERCREHGFDRARRCLETIWETCLDELVATLDAQLGRLRPHVPKFLACAIYEDSSGAARGIRRSRRRLRRGNDRGHDRTDYAGRRFSRPVPNPSGLAGLGRTFALPRDRLGTPSGRHERRRDAPARARRTALRRRGARSDRSGACSRPHWRLLSRGRPNAPHLRPRARLRRTEPLARPCLQRLRRPRRRGRAMRLRALRRRPVWRMLVELPRLRQRALLGLRNVLRRLPAAAVRIVSGGLRGCQRMCCEGCLDEGLCSACQAEQEQETDQEHESDEAIEIPSASEEFTAAVDRDGNDATVQPHWAKTSAHEPSRPSRKPASAFCSAVKESRAPSTDSFATYVAEG